MSINKICLLNMFIVYTVHKDLQALLKFNRVTHKYRYSLLPTVPMDLDVKAKATMLGACFLVVSNINNKSSIDTMPCM